MAVISCDRHDYIEIACMFEMAVEVRLRDGPTARGIARDIRVFDGCEFLVLSSIDAQGAAPDVPETVTIELTQMRSMRALLRNQHFETVDF